MECHHRISLKVFGDGEVYESVLMSHNAITPKLVLSTLKISEVECNYAALLT